MSFDKIIKKEDIEHLTKDLHNLELIKHYKKINFNKNPYDAEEIHFEFVLKSENQGVNILIFFELNKTYSYVRIKVVNKSRFHDINTKKEIALKNVSKNFFILNKQTIKCLEEKTKIYFIEKLKTEKTLRLKFLVGKLTVWHSRDSLTREKITIDTIRKTQS